MEELRMSLGLHLLQAGEGVDSFYKNIALQLVPDTVTHSESLETEKISLHWDGCVVRNCEDFDDCEEEEEEEEEKGNPKKEKKNKKKNKERNKKKNKENTQKTRKTEEWKQKEKE